MLTEEQQAIATELSTTGNRLREITEGRPVSFILTYCLADDISAEEIHYIGDTIGAITPLALSPEIAVAAALTVDAGIGTALAHLLALEPDRARQAQGEHLMRIITALRLADVLPYSAENEPIYDSMQSSICARLANGLKWREREGDFYASFGESANFKVESDPAHVGQWRIQIKIKGAMIATHDEIPSLDEAQQLVARVWVRLVQQWGHEIAFQTQGR